MTAKEYLERIYKLQRKINGMKIRSEEYSKLALSVPGPKYEPRIGTNPTPNSKAPFEIWVKRKVDLDGQIAKLEEELNELRKEAMLKIDMVENEDYKNVLILRYLDFYTWTEIAGKMFCSEKTVRRWNNEALKQICV